jgi:hypothetical protein
VAGALRVRLDDAASLSRGGHSDAHSSFVHPLRADASLTDRARARPSCARPQVPLVTAANRASRAAARSVGVPLLDLAQLTSTDAKTAAACATSVDGVHVAQWVDMLRAQLLLSYLCDAHGRFRGDDIARGVARGLHPRLARCALHDAAAPPRGARPARRRSPALPSERDVRLLYVDRTSRENRSCLEW